MIDNFISKLECIDINKNINFYILLDELENIKLFKNKRKIVFLPNDSPIHFEENLLNSFNSDILVDFTVSEHSGLSFRIFEAIGYSKKLITTNTTIKEYDFYNSNNIFIIENENIDINELKKFLLLPICELPKNIIEKYYFTAWISKITS
ncbi:hypothetical protein ACI3P4_05410 [Glaesserella parasuis]|uniref:hypothetical protein n=1 Tax=Glaesserella parasuis TaxID=738 RepID=UPI003851E7DA